MIKTANRSIGQNGKGDDRVKVVHFDSTTIAAILADGAGGTSGGGRAADIVVGRLSQYPIADFGELFDAILNLDHENKLDPDAGLSTLVSVFVNGDEFIGAVIGDSDAILIQDDKLSNLAPEKEVKPLLGDGEAFPTLFSGSLVNTTLLLCS